MTAGEIISAYQEAHEPPLSDADLAREWGVNRSTVCRIKKGEKKLGDKTWEKIQQKTPHLYPILREFYYGVSLPEAHQTAQDGREGFLRRVLRIVTFGKYHSKQTKP